MPNPRAPRYARAQRSIDAHGGASSDSYGTGPNPADYMQPEQVDPAVADPSLGIQMPMDSSPLPDPTASMMFEHAQPRGLASLPPTSYDRDIAAGQSRMDQGDQMVSNAYNRIAPTRKEPTFGLKDLILGALPAMLLAGRGGAEGARPAIQYATGYLGGKQQRADQDYQRDSTQFDRKVAGEVQTGRTQSEQGQRMISHAQDAQARGMTVVQSLANRMAMMKDPTALPMIVRSFNEAARNAGVSGMEISDDEAASMVKGLKDAQDHDTAAKTAYHLYTAFNAAKDGKGKLIAGAPLLKIAEQWPDILPGMGAHVAEIQEGLGQATEWEKTQQSIQKKNGAMTLFTDARRETEDLMRKPKQDYMIAGTGLRNQNRQVGVKRAALLGLQAQFLPRELAVKEQNARTALISANSNIQADQYRNARIEQLMQMEGLPHPDAIVTATKDWEKQLATAASEKNGYMLKGQSIKAQIDGIELGLKDPNAQGAVILPKKDATGFDLDPQAVLYQLKDDLNEIHARIAKADEEMKQGRVQKANLETLAKRVEQSSLLPPVRGQGGMFGNIGIQPDPNAGGSRVPPTPPPNQAPGIQQQAPPPVTDLTKIIQGTNFTGGQAIEQINKLVTSKKMTHKQAVEKLRSLGINVN